MIFDGILFPQQDNECPVIPPENVPVTEPTNQFEWALAYGEAKLFWFFNGEADRFNILYQGVLIAFTEEQHIALQGFHFVNGDTTFIIRAIKDTEIIDEIVVPYYEGMTDAHCVVEGDVISLFGTPIANINVYLMPSEPTPIIVDGKVVSHTKALTKTDENGNFSFVVIKGASVTLLIPAANYQKTFKLPDANPPYIAPFRG